MVRTHQNLNKVRKPRAITGNDEQQQQLFLCLCSMQLVIFRFGLTVGLYCRKLFEKGQIATVPLTLIVSHISASMITDNPNLLGSKREDMKHQPRFTSPCLYVNSVSLLHSFFQTDPAYSIR